VALLAATSNVHAVSSQTYNWKNVKIGGGGGFVPGIVFNPTEKGLAYARTDIGGAYRLNSDDTWTPLLDFADNSRWNYWGVDALATDPVDTKRLYLATGMYTNSWDPNNGQILISTDKGATFTASALPFKVGGNMPGRGTGERLSIDPNKNSILYFGARSGKGLWKSTDYGATWAQVTAFPSVGTYIPDSSDTSGYNSDIVGITWVTFDSTSGTSGTATPRIFVGVANKGSNNVFVSENAGSTWSAVAGQNNTYIPHKGVIDPHTKGLFVTYSDGAGPYDGTAGSLYRYNITTKAWTDITPASLVGDQIYGFGGLTIDYQAPGTIMAAALNLWWPDAQIFRSTDSGATWKDLWTWDSPGVSVKKNYKYSDSLAPWLGPGYTVTTTGYKQIGWMIESLVIDPFDSNHWLYGTGATIQGGRDLKTWDTTGNITLQSLADGIEETAVQGLISPPSGPQLISAVGDIEGFVHNSLTAAPAAYFSDPVWTTTSDIDFAGNNPKLLVRSGTATDGATKQVALSSDAGATWYQFYGAADGVSGSKIALSANGGSILWKTSANGIQNSQNSGSFATVSSLPSAAVIASDKKTDTVFYGASGSSFYLSTNSGSSFTAVGTLGSSTSPVKIAVNPSVTGDVWVSTDKGLFHSTNNGTTFTAISGVTQAWAIALGAPAKTGGYPTIFAAANIGGVGYFRSDDTGVNWVKINDAAHGFGSVSSNPLTADPRVYGRVYIGTNGRGIFYGDASGSTSTSVSTSSTSSSSSSSSSSSHSSSSSSSSSTTSSPTTTPTGVAGAYQQCGGSGFTGPTTCVTGYKCVRSNDFYSQCVPA